MIGKLIGDGHYYAFHKNERPYVVLAQGRLHDFLEPEPV